MFFDTDCAGVVHNIAYLRFIETARTLLAGELGMSLPEMARSQQFPVVVRTEIDYKRPATLGDTLVTEGWLERLERIRFWCGFTIRRKGDDNTVLVYCRQMLALVQMPAGKPVRMSRPVDGALRASAARQTVRGSRQQPEIRRTGNVATTLSSVIREGP